MKINSENLVPANMDALKLAMREDERLFNFLNTATKDLPINYRYIIYEISTGCETLLDVIKLAIGAGYMIGVIPYFFKRDDDKIAGFAGYIDGYNEIYNLKIFSFNPVDEDIIPLDIFVKFLGELVATHNRVSWNTLKDNPTNKIFEKIIQYYSGYVSEYVDTKENVRYQYTIERQLN
jgi:hypothetical protein